MQIMGLVPSNSGGFLDHQIVDTDIRLPGGQQRRYVQRNDSWGRVVPIETLAREVGMKRAGLRQGELWRRGDRVR